LKTLLPEFKTPTSRETDDHLIFSLLYLLQNLFIRFIFISILFSFS
jgi:hypothetical protein